MTDRSGPFIGGCGEERSHEHADTHSRRLDAVEVDADGAMAEWRKAVEAFDAESFAGDMGL